MHRMQVLHGFDLHDYLAFHDEIEPLWSKRAASIAHDDFPLPLEPNL